MSLTDKFRAPNIKSDAIDSIKISVVVCTYNRVKFINSCLEHLVTQTLPARDYEIIIINNNCKDNTEQVVNDFIVNNHNAMLFIRELKDDALTPSIIFELHKILSNGTLDVGDEDKAGVFRTAEDDICVFSKEGDLLHVPPKASELTDRLQRICDFANKVGEDNAVYIPPIIRGIIIHFMLSFCSFSVLQIPIAIWVRHD